MKRLTSMLLISIFISSCIQDRQHDNTISEKSEAIVTVDTVGNAEIEKNLKYQLNEYMVALNGGDPDKAVTY
mgnify:CR=1 FL=1